MRKRVIAAVALCAGFCGLLSACGYNDTVRRDIRVVRVAGNLVTYTERGRGPDRQTAFITGPASNLNLHADSCYQIVYAPADDWILGASVIACE